MTDQSVSASATNAWSIIVRTGIVHTATYFVVGLTAFYAFNYTAEFSQGSLSAIMRPTSDPWVAAGPLFQPLRGLLFGFVLYLLRDSIFTRPRGWLVAWATLAIVGILNTFGPVPGSIEGAIYLNLPFASQFGPGLIEVFVQSLLLAAGSWAWVRNPRNACSWGFSIIAALAILAALAGIFLAPYVPA
ncbi:MAG: hypothetical protein EOP22_04695 [Hyphomicrobiales bacterium]|nr:MAG: hypothetical protein EOP22_04695 [Hyphomicrobiales bacterium]